MITVITRTPSKEYYIELFPIAQIGYWLEMKVRSIFGSKYLTCLS